jgi:hypothetical protein
MIYGLTIFMLCRQPSIFDRAFDRINLAPFRIIHLPLSAFAFPGLIASNMRITW